MIRNVFLIFVLLTGMFHQLKGQEELKNPLNIAFKPQYGLILPHSSKIEHLAYTHPFGLEFEYAWLMLKDQNWQQCNCYSKTGFSFLYINFDNPEIVGHSYNLIAFAEPFFIRTKQFLFSARMGVGVSFLDKIYDKDDNAENLFFSTHISFIAHLDVNAYYQLNPKYSIMAYAKYNHISNGGVKQPNYGMNFPMFGLGINYFPLPKPNFPHRTKQAFSASLFYQLCAFGMIKKVKEKNNFPEETTAVFGVYGLAGRTVSKLNGFSLGFEYMNDGGAKVEISREQSDEDHQQIACLIGHHLLFGKFDFSQQWGIYLYAPYTSRNYYQRYAISYELATHLFAGVTLKAHGDAADSFHVMLGYSF